MCRDLAGRLGHAVGLEHRDPRALLEPVGHDHGQRRRGRPDEPDPAGHGLARPQRAEARDDGGHRVDPRDRPLGHQVPEAAPVETVVENQAGTGHQGREQAHDLGIDVEERKRIEAAVSGVELQMRGHATRRVEQLVLTQPDHLGRAGGARRRQHDAAGSGATGAPLPRDASRARPAADQGGPARSIRPRRRPGRVGRPARRRHRSAPGWHQARHCLSPAVTGRAVPPRTRRSRAPRNASANSMGSWTARPMVAGRGRARR